MRRGAALVALVFVTAWLALIGYAVYDSRPHLDLNHAMHSTVVLSDGEGGASGVVIGLHTILTAWHVAEHPGLTAETFDGRKLAVDTTWVYQGSDFALVQTKDDLGLPVAPLSCAPLYVGEHITIIGHPYLEIMWNVTSGAVSTLKPVRAETGLPQQPYLVGLDATAAPGNSGGPIFDDAGHVIGLLDAARAEGLTFAIPMSELCRTAGALFAAR